MTDFVDGVVNLLQKLDVSPCAIALLLLALASYWLVDRANARGHEMETKRLEQFNRMLEIIHK